MFKIQTLNKIAAIGLDQLPRDQYEVASEILNPDAVLVRSADMLKLELPATLKGIARAGAGVNNIPVDTCTGKGVVVFNTPGANANGVKELVIAGLIMAARNVAPALVWARSLSGKGEEVPKLIEKGKGDYAGVEIKGKKLGVIGLGAIGVMVANDAEALGMEVSGYDPFISVEAAWGLSRTVKRAPRLETLIAESDYITLHLPLSDKTKGLIGKEKFAIMKKGVRLVNFARGGLVNNKDLKNAIAEGIIAAYVTDFPDDELISMDNVVAIPHLGASTEEAENNCAIMAVRQLRNFLENGDVKNSVNFPDCGLPRSAAQRIVVATDNVPNMLGQITAILAADKVNIAEMLNKSKGQLAYNIIDVDSAVTEKHVERIKGIKGVIMARIV
jgi:D-3-phosphoglycerate dehydrogenase